MTAKIQVPNYKKIKTFNLFNLFNLFDLYDLFNCLGFGEYYFYDTPTSADDNIPALAKGEIAKKKI